MKRTLTKQDVLRLLRQEIQSFGSQAKWAAANGFSPAYLSDVLNCRRDLSDRILWALKIEQEVVYRKVGQ